MREECGIVLVVVSSIIGFLLGIAIMSLLLYVLPDNPYTAFVVFIVIIGVIALVMWVVNLYLGTPK